VRSVDARKDTGSEVLLQPYWEIRKARIGRCGAAINRNRYRYHLPKPADRAPGFSSRTLRNRWPEPVQPGTLYLAHAVFAHHIYAGSKRHLDRCNRLQILQTFNHIGEQ